MSCGSVAKRLIASKAAMEFFLPDRLRQNDPSIRYHDPRPPGSKSQEEDHEPSRLSFHADHLPERLDDLHEIRLGGHHRLDRLVRRRSLVDYILILPAFHAFRHSLVIFYCKSALGFVARHRTPGAMTATAETLRVPFALNDVGTR